MPPDQWPATPPLGLAPFPSLRWGLLHQSPFRLSFFTQNLHGNGAGSDDRTARPVLLGRSTGSWHLTMTGPRRATDTNPSLRGKKSQYYTVSTSIKLIRRMSSSVSVMVGGIKYGTGEGSGRKPYRMQATARSTVHDWSKLQCSHRYSTIRLLLQLPSHWQGPWTSSTLRSMHQLASDGAHLQRARSCKHPKMQIGRWRKRSLPLPVQARPRVRALIEPPKIIK